MKTVEEQPTISYTDEPTSWMREANVDPLVKSYTKHRLLGRNDYFFRIVHYSDELSKKY